MVVLVPSIGILFHDDVHVPPCHPSKRQIIDNTKDFHGLPCTVTRDVRLEQGFLCAVALSMSSGLGVVAALR
nr:hypothetical protein CFP56_10005 [Quercus suber]